MFARVPSRDQDLAWLRQALGIDHLRFRRGRGAREAPGHWATGPAPLRRYAAAVDTFLAIASKREVRSYADRLLPDESQRRILDAGRVAGSSANRQRSRFVVVTDRDRLERLAETVYTPDNVRGAPRNPS